MSFKVFVDSDGVCADFDNAAREILGGIRPRDFEDQQGAEELWNRIYSQEEFFYNLDPMHDMHDLLDGIEALGFIPEIITGVPRPRGDQKSSVPAPDQKRRWFAKHRPGIKVHTCRSAEKYKFASKGDVLIDDWEKYLPLWRAAGGHFIVHTSAKESLKALGEYIETHYLPSMIQ